ncbi:MAG TPA: MerR family transcriptional regulator [Verrucomicrobiae bacterium]
MESRHPIKVAARKTGLTPHVIRVWERRYGAVQPSRSGTNRRLYSDADIEHLQLLCQLTKAGYSIGGIASLPAGELRELSGKIAGSCTVTSPENTTTSTLTLAPENLAIVQFVEEALNAICKMNDSKLEEMLIHAGKQFGRDNLLQKLVPPLIQMVGDRWESGQVKVAQEHFASAILRTFLSNTIKACPPVESAPVLVVSTPPGQLHELGAILIAALAANQGWRVTYLGPNLPAEEVGAAALLCGARAVALSIVYPVDDPRLSEELLTLRESLPTDMAILIGGRAAPAYAPTVTSTGIQHLDCLLQFTIKLDELRATRPACRCVD